MPQIYDPVKVATTTDVALGTPLSSGASKIDNVIVNSGDRILVKSQTNRTQNGIYTLGANGFLARASDFAAASSQLGGQILFVQDGATFADTGWVLANIGTVVVDSAEIYFETFTVNQKLQGAEIPSSIVLRLEKGYPLTNDELDNNFKFLSLSLTQKLNVVDFTPIAITTRIRTLSAEEANLNAFALRGLAPSYGTDINTIAVRDQDGTITSTKFFGALEGNASTATLAARATIANNVNGIVQVVNGGTGSNTPEGARTNLSVVGRSGDTMTGKLVIESGIQATVTPALNLTPVTSNPLTIVNGDVWTTSTDIFYKLNGVTKTVASLESPTFTGSVIAPNPEFASNSGAVATTKFVQNQVTALNTSINLKSNIAAPTFTGDAKAVTADLTNETTSIATTLYVKNKVTNILGAYYNKPQVDGLLATLNTNLSNDIDSVDTKATEALERSGLPVGSVAYFAGNAIPSGWLKCNGAQISTAGYAKLFQTIGYTYGGQGNFFRLPDLRGEFLRGFDDGRGVDANRAFGSSQNSQVQQHKHVAPYAEAYDGPFGKTNNNGYQGSNRTDSDNFLYHTNDGSDYNGVVNAAGVIGNETRPRNVAMMACIKAFGDIDDSNAIQATSVLNIINNKIDKTGDTMTGFLTLAANPTNALHAATKSYVDSSISTISLTPGPKGETISVKDFGAVGDGVTNDTAAIQAVVDFLTPGGGTVYLPTGTYLVDTIVFPYDRGTTNTTPYTTINLIGSGMTSSILLMNNPASPVIQMSRAVPNFRMTGSTFSDFAVKANPLGSVGNSNHIAIDTVGFDAVIFRRIKFISNGTGSVCCMFRTIAEPQLTYSQVFEGIVASGNVGPAYVLKTQGNGTNALSNTNIIQVRDCWVYNNSDMVTAFDMSACSLYQVINCEIESSGNYAISCGLRGTIIGNWMETVAIAPLEFVSTVAGSSSQNTIMGNYFSGFSGAIVQPSTDNTSNIFINNAGGNWTLTGPAKKYVIGAGASPAAPVLTKTFGGAGTLTLVAANLVSIMDQTYDLLYTFAPGAAGNFGFTVTPPTGYLNVKMIASAYDGPNGVPYASAVEYPNTGFLVTAPNTNLITLHVQVTAQ